MNRGAWQAAVVALQRVTLAVIWEGSGPADISEEGVGGALRCGVQP